MNFKELSPGLAEELEKIRGEQKAPAEKAPSEPANNEPANNNPVKTEPVAQESATQEQVAQESTTQEPAAQEPAAQEPAAQESAKQTPVAKSLKELIDEDEAAQARIAKMKEIEELANDEFVKLVLDTKKSGGDVKKLLAGLAETNPDSLTDEEIYYMTLPSDMDADEKRDEYEKFETLNSRFKETIINEQREKLKKVQSEKLTALMGSGQKVDVRPAFNEATVGLDAALEKLQGKEYQGIELTPARLLELRKEAIRFFGTFMDTDKGAIDYNEALETAFARKAVTAWSEEIKKAGKNEGKIEAFKEIHNPSAMRSVGTATNKGQRDSQAEMDAIWAKLNTVSTTIR